MAAAPALTTDEDCADFAAWLRTDYVPIAGGWQY
jgi:hypothetical protein